jgi:putative ABC transport system permease protein
MPLSPQVPLSYIARNLWVRRVTTVLTASGMGLVVYVFATVLMMSEGIRDTLVATGSVDNVMVLRKGAGAEINSGISREQAEVIASLPEIATSADGHALISREPVVLNTLPKRGSGKPSNVAIRGTSVAGMGLRPQVKPVQGRPWRVASCTPAWARPCALLAASGAWWASSMARAAALIPRSGAMASR